MSARRTRSFKRLLNYGGSARYYLWSFKKLKSTTHKQAECEESFRNKNENLYSGRKKRAEKEEKLSMVENQSKFHTFLWKSWWRVSTLLLALVIFYCTRKTHSEIWIHPLSYCAAEKSIIILFISTVNSNSVVEVCSSTTRNGEI